MNDDKKVLACVDQSKYAESVTDYATWAARRMQAPMELLHVIDRHPKLEAVQDHSGAIGLDAQEGSMTFRVELDKPVKTCRGGLAGRLRL